MLSNCFFVKLFNVYPGTGKMQQAPDGSGDFHIKSKEICSSYLLGLTNAVLVPQPQKVHSGNCCGTFQDVEGKSEILLITKKSQRARYGT